ncbi:aminocarboxymuconate-semialdehyde decarboxylase [Actinomycetospora succinea]|uniref:Aminocarboxymuconate-semialdehyde decarboxylase n=1 Tax=Actinomycetospora succinea TaxID=663603 RepID=A0A4V3D8I6_9PSEU|nr:amidohydrolase family protein [Actinomycetospora succinea]TDQ51807.1 aminocarboxymuconate-semialdehyde decarboxylase [Actinomycetospora succinea]
MSEGVLDVHAHAVLRSSEGAAGAAGPELGTSSDGRPFYRVGDYVLHGVRYEGSPFMDVDLRLAAMDAAGIARQLLSPNPLTYFGDLPVDDAVSFARRHNDGLAALVAEHPDRLLAAAQLPVQDVADSVTEARRAVRDLGMSAIYLDTDPAGRTLDDPALDPLYEAVVELDVPLFVHPSPIGPDGPPADPRLRRFDLDLQCGFAYDETLAVAALVFGGVLERHPELDVCLSHGGGAAAFLAGRFARAARKRPWASDALREQGFEAWFQRLWLDVHVHDEGSLDLLAARADPARLVFGTNFAGWDSDADDTPTGPWAQALTANAERLLRITPTATSAAGDAPSP